MHTEYKKLIATPPHSEGPGVKVWTIKKDEIIRINLVEMRGELGLHKHPDAPHSIMVLEGSILATLDNREILLEKGDFLSIPANVPHQYRTVCENAWIISMDAPYYDPRKTIQLAPISDPSTSSR